MPIAIGPGIEQCSGPVPTQSSRSSQILSRLLARCISPQKDGEDQHRRSMRVKRRLRKLIRSGSLIPDNADELELINDSRVRGWSFSVTTHPLQPVQYITGIEIEKMKLVEGTLPS